jgi:hypothetical protein
MPVTSWRSIELQTRGKRSAASRLPLAFEQDHTQPTAVSFCDFSFEMVAQGNELCPQ